MSDFFRGLMKEVKGAESSIIADGKSAAEYSGTIDTGCYILNAALSGSIFGGVPNNKITGFAGESSTGKTFFVLAIVQNFLDMHPDGGVVFYDSEAAVTNEMMTSRGIDTNRVIVVEPDTIQSFRHHAIMMLDAYIAKKDSERPPMLFVLDSLGMLSSTKELEDTAEGKDTRDMTKAQIIKAAFRVLTLKCAKAGVPMLVTNHVYAGIGMYAPPQVLGGGNGFKYAASTIAMISKRKDKDGKEIVGNIIKVKMFKSRLSRENTEVELKLSYTNGLDKWYGLLDLALAAGVFKKVKVRYELPNGELVFGKHINEDPEKYFSPYLEQIDKAAKKMFTYGADDDIIETDDISETEEIVEIE